MIEIKLALCDASLRLHKIYLFTKQHCADLVNGSLFLLENNGLLLIFIAKPLYVVIDIANIAILPLMFISVMLEMFLSCILLFNLDIRNLWHQLELSHLETHILVLFVTKSQHLIIPANEIDCAINENTQLEIFKGVILLM